jgi:hypothetical protein
MNDWRPIGLLLFVCGGLALVRLVIRRMAK